MNENGSEGRQDSTRQQSLWDPVKEFTSEGLSVQVVCQQGSRPKYALVLGASYTDPKGAQRRGARINLFIIGGQLRPVRCDVLQQLIEEAQAWVDAKVQEERATRETSGEIGDRPAKRRQNDDNRQRSHAGPVLGLKELSKRDKQAWQQRQQKKEAGTAETPPTS